MSERPRPASGVVARWEALSATVQGAAVFPVAAVALFLANLLAFGQPLGRSAVYGIIEGLPVTALVLVATANEKRKRRP